MISVIRCDKEIERPSDRETERPSEVAINADSILPLVPLVPGSQGLEEKPVTEETKVPLWQHIGDMFPDVKPQQSMAAWDDDTPF